MTVIEWTLIALILAIAGDIARRAWQAKRARDADRPEDYCA